jgi:hypothetical protein
MTDQERQKLLGNLRMAKLAAPTYAKQWCGEAADEIERLAEIIADYKLVFGDIHKVTLNKQPPGPDSILHELGECPDASTLETAADLIERLAHELVATNERLVQLEARLEALERM